MKVFGYRLAEKFTDLLPAEDDFVAEEYDSVELANELSQPSGPCLLIYHGSEYDANVVSGYVPQCLVIQISTDSPSQSDDEDTGVCRFPIGVPNSEKSEHDRVVRQLAQKSLGDIIAAARSGDLTKVEEVCKAQFALVRQQIADRDRILRGRKAAKGLFNAGKAHYDPDAVTEDIRYALELEPRSSPTFEELQSKYLEAEARKWVRSSRENDPPSSAPGTGSDSPILDIGHLLRNTLMPALRHARSTQSTNRRDLLASFEKVLGSLQGGASAESKAAAAELMRLRTQLVSWCHSDTTSTDDLEAVIIGVDMIVHDCERPSRG